MQESRFLDEIVLGDCLDLFEKVPDDSVRTIHTSPPYNIDRGYHGYDDNLAHEEYLGFLERVLSECRRVLVPGGSLFWQTGYTTEQNGYITPLDHLTSPLFRKLGFRLKDRIIWRYWGGTAFKAKFTNKHETILWWIKPGSHATKPKFDVFRVREATKFLDSRNNLFGRNPGNVWEVDRVAFGSNDQTSHIAVFPEEISDRIILATTDEGETVLDPFSGSGTVCKMAKARGRKFLGFEISPLYHAESVQRVSLQAQGELLAVLSEILKAHILEVGRKYRVSAVAEKAATLLGPLALEPYEKTIPKRYLEALRDGRENGVKKADKIALWKDLEEILPPADSRSSPNDPAGLISFVDQAFLEAYRLHRVYNSAMRFHCAAKWMDALGRLLKPNPRQQWKKVLSALAGSETGSYRLEEDRLTLAYRDKKARTDRVDEPALADSRGEPTGAGLF